MFSHTASGWRIARIVGMSIVATSFGVQTSHAQVAATDADADADIPSVTVQYDDLNLGSVEGSRVLYRRLEAAATQVCPKVGYVTELRQNEDARRCIKASIERAAKEIKSPRFAEVAASKLR